MNPSSDIVPREKSETLTVLLVEDEVLLRMVIADHFREAGFNLLEAANGEEARKIVGAIEDIDIVVSDIHMSTASDGLDLASWLIDNAPEIPVILTSGSRSIAAGAGWKGFANVTDFVPKPYSVEEMERLVRVRARTRDASSK
jgi:DNA-binding NtrC family response regulator